MKQSCGLKNLICIQLASACSLVLGDYGPSESCFPGQKNPFRSFFFSSWFVHPKQLWILVCKKEVNAISTLVFRRKSKLLGFIAQRHQGNPKSRYWRVCSWKCQALLWVGTWSLLDSSQKMFPTLISKRLLGDFLWYRKLYCYIHRTSSNNFGVVRVNGSNTRNYMLWLHIYPLLVICRSSLFSLQIKKSF